MPTAMAPMACAAPEARTAPPAPALMAGIAGNDPTVIRIALMRVMALGCSLVRKSSAVHAFRSQMGAFVTTDTVNGDDVSLGMRRDRLSFTILPFTCLF